MEPEERRVRKRRRPMSSCEQCRRRKVKCDQKSPCDQCVKSKCASCVYYRFHPSSQQDVRSRAQEPLLAEKLFSKEGKGHSDIEGRLPQSLVSSPVNTSRLVTSGSVCHESPLPESRSVRELRDKIDRLAKELSIAQSAEVTSERLLYANVNDLKGVVSKTRLMGRSHFMYIVKQGYVSIVDLYRAFESQNPGEDLLEGIERCKKLGKSIKEKHKWHQTLSPDLKSYVPEKGICDILLEAYFRTFESVHRILHAPSFYEEYNRFWSQPEKASPTFLIKLLLVLSIGAAFQLGQDSFNELRESAKIWVHVAHSWITHPFGEKHILSLSGVQIHCLILLSREISEIGTDMTWIAAGSLLRIAMLIGLHRDPLKFPGMSEFQTEMRRRLWATVSEICFTSCMITGGLPLLDLKDTDCLPPRNLNDDQIGEAILGIPVEKGENEMTQTTIQRMLAQTLPVRLRGAAALNNTMTELSFSETNKFGTELTQLYQGQLRRLASFTGQFKPTAFQMRMLKLINVGTLGSLHMPFAIQARDDPLFFFSKKTCLDVALAVLTPDDLSSDEWALGSSTAIRDSRCLDIVGGGYFRALSTTAAIMLYGDLTNFDASTTMFTSAAESVLRNETDRAIAYFSDLTLERLKAGERNIKGHLFANVILAQAAAKANGLPPELEILKALKEAVERCIAILEARAGPTQTPGSETTAIGSEQFALDAFAKDIIPEPYWWDDLDFDSQDMNFSRAWNLL